MIINLFTIFDPSTSISMSLNWFRSIFALILIPSFYWMIPSRYILLNYILLRLLFNEFKVLINKKLNLLNIIIYIRIFVIIILNNLMGIFPYIFTSSSHIIFGLSLSLTIWFSFILYGWIINTNHIFIHLVPQGTPIVLISFIVIIESIRNFIRPGTLSVRLAANIIAGHLLITLISSTGSSLSFIILIFILLVQCILILLELRVAFIQAYVFTVLSTLYRVESS